MAHRNFIYIHRRRKLLRTSENPVGGDFLLRDIRVYNVKNPPLHKNPPLVCPGSVTRGGILKVGPSKNAKIFKIKLK